MSTKVMVLVGTRKGAFMLTGDAGRDGWQTHGPFCQGWSAGHVTYDPATRSLYAGGGNAWFGASVWRSRDMGETWDQSSQGLTYGDAGPKLNTIWNITPAHGALYAGVDPAGLFRSDDGGVTWSHVAGLRDHPSTPEWAPGNGGLCLHTIVPHPTDPAQMWVGISAVGAFYTADGGAHWEARNRGVRADFSPDPYPELGLCVHKMGMAPGDTSLLYQQNHCGVYRSRNGGVAWEEISEGLPSTFGFPLGLHPRDDDTLYTIPLNGDSKGRYMPDASAAVWRSRDAGDTWTRLSKGLPQENAYFNVLREAMAVDRLDPAGIYFGTGNGQLYASNDEGDNWTCLAEHLPPITSVEVAVLENGRR